MIPYVLNGLAALALERGELERAASLIGAAEGLMEEQEAAWPPDEQPHYERTVARLTEELGTDSFQQTRAAGRTMSSSDAVKFVLNPD